MLNWYTLGKMVYRKTPTSYVICGVTAIRRAHSYPISPDFIRKLICFLLRTVEKTDVDGGNKTKQDKMTGETG